VRDLVSFSSAEDAWRKKGRVEGLELMVNALLTLNAIKENKPDGNGKRERDGEGDGITRKAEHSSFKPAY
jgi:hypothetical protein